MSEEMNYKTLSLLKIMFPDFRNSLDHICGHDSVFREIAAENKECFDEHESIYKETGEWSDLFTETINELEEEINTYLVRTLKIT